MRRNPISRALWIGGLALGGAVVAGVAYAVGSSKSTSQPSPQPPGPPVPNPSLPPVQKTAFGNDGSITIKVGQVLNYYPASLIWLPPGAKADTAALQSLGGGTFLGASVGAANVSGSFQNLDGTTASSKLTVNVVA